MIKDEIDEIGNWIKSKSSPTVFMSFLKLLESEMRKLTTEEQEYLRCMLTDELEIYENYQKVPGSVTFSLINSDETGSSKNVICIYVLEFDNSPDKNIIGFKEPPPLTMH